jgi:hypothetical protein
MPEFLGYKFNYRVGQFDYLTKKKNLSIEKFNVKSKRERERENYLKGALIVHKKQLHEMNKLTSFRWQRN